MSTNQTQPTNPEPYRDIAASHIRSLSTLSARLPALLTTSATTFSQLTNAPINPPSSSSPATTPDTLSARRAALSTSANAFFTSVIEVGKALHGQIDDLERHGVIPTEEVRYRAPVQQQGIPGAMGAGAQQRDSEASVVNGGLGDFDVGVLNARAGVRQKDGEEVLGRVKKVLEDLVGDTKDQDEEMVDG